MAPCQRSSRSTGGCSSPAPGGRYRQTRGAGGGSRVAGGDGEAAWRDDDPMLVASVAATLGEEHVIEHDIQT
jgi:hypothetical protein